MVYYKPIKMIINILALAKVIIETIMQQYGLFNSIFSDPDLVFILKFWSSQFIS